MSKQQEAEIMICVYQFLTSDENGQTRIYREGERVRAGSGSVPERFPAYFCSEATDTAERSAAKAAAMVGGY
jgi:hypothetical protein